MTNVITVILYLKKYRLTFLKGELFSTMKNRILLLFFIILSVQQGHAKSNMEFSEIRHPYNSLSPEISRLETLDENKLKKEINNFYDKILMNGTPFIEKDPLYDDYVYMTMIYKAESKDPEVAFEVFGVDSEYSFGNKKLNRLRDTDLFYRCYLVPDDLCFSYRFNITDIATGKSRKETDKYNPERIPKGSAKNYSYSVLDLDNNSPDWNSRKYGDTGSSLETLAFDSTIMFNFRNIYLYLPPGYDSDKKNGYPVIYLFDSFIYLNRVEVPNVLDNLIKENRIEPMIAVMIDNPDKTSRKTELPYNYNFMEFITTELVPFIRYAYNTSNDPDKNIIGGMSYGGIAAAFIAYYHPEMFGKVLAQSGSFWRDPEINDPHGNQIRTDWLINNIITDEPKKLIFYLDWGLQENLCLSSGRKMARILDRKGYKYKYKEFNGWHDWSNSRKTFPDGLMYLLED